MRCFKCEKIIFTEEKKYFLCDCANLCYECFLEKYVIYNAPPSRIIKNCQICEKTFPIDRQRYLLIFTMDYWSSENYFF